MSNPSTPSGSLEPDASRKTSHDDTTPKGSVAHTDDAATPVPTPARGGRPYISVQQAPASAPPQMEANRSKLGLGIFGKKKKVQLKRLVVEHSCMAQLITTKDISAPVAFEHVAHVGRDVCEM